jgi:hypothetical protein
MLQTMFCSCNHFERTGLPCVHQACVATYCHQFASNSPSVFKGFTHHDISVRWWSSYMYFAYKSSTPPEMVHKFHALAVKDIMGPKLRCHINLSLIAIADPHIILPAIEQIKNYPKDAICLSDVSKTSVSQSSRVHLSQTNSELMEDELLSNIADYIQQGSTGHLDDLFSHSIMNSDFPLTHHVSTREALKQLWEESCSEADNLDNYAMNGNARLELESCLISFRQYCNQRKTSSDPTSTSSGKEKVRWIIPMTQGKYAGKSDRVFNTHHF